MVVFRIDTDNLTSGIKLRGNNGFVGFECHLPQGTAPIGLNWTGQWGFFLFETSPDLVPRYIPAKCEVCNIHSALPPSAKSPKYDLVTPCHILYLKLG